MIRGYILALHVISRLYSASKERELIGNIIDNNKHNECERCIKMFDEKCKECNDLGLQLLRANIEITRLRKEIDQYKSRKWFEFWKK